MNILDEISRLAKELNIDPGIVDISLKIFHDDRPKLDCAYLFAETEDNQGSIFKSAAEIRGQEIAREFWVTDSENPIWPGYTKWRNHLGQIIGYANIKSIPLGTPNHNTLTESQALVKYAKENKQSRIYVVAPPFHQLRAFVTTASEAIKENNSLSIFSYIGDLPIDDEYWNTEVVHSQGVLKNTRAGLMGDELNRIKNYSNILPPKLILDYIDKRRI